MIADILSVIIAYGLALLLRFDMRYSKIPEQYLVGYGYYIALAAIVTVAAYIVAKLYRSVWTYAGISEVLRTCVASLIAAVVTDVVFSISIIPMLRTASPISISM